MLNKVFAWNLFPALGAHDKPHCLAALIFESEKPVLVLEEGIPLTLPLGFSPCSAHAIEPA
jgi:hypothetical protein